ncbi:MAG: ribosome maturation factor RimM [Zoogloeaceae bacterium]|nr:ribosome maturation factor RimM [Zoogloeaceae bacterium]
MPDDNLPSEEIIVLGRIIAPHGVQGWVHIKPFGDDPESWREIPVWSLGKSEKGPWQETRSSGFRVQNDTVLMAFSGICDRTAAEEKLQGLWLAAPRSALPVLQPGEFYWGDLIGMRVTNLAKAELGLVVGLIATGANDVLRVQDAAGGEHLLPFVDAVVKEVHTAVRQIVVDWEADW